MFWEPHKIFGGVAGSKTRLNNKGEFLHTTELGAVSARIIVTTIVHVATPVVLVMRLEVVVLTTQAGKDTSVTHCSEHHEKAMTEPSRVNMRQREPRSRTMSCEAGISTWTGRSGTCLQNPNRTHGTRVTGLKVGPIA